MARVADALKKIGYAHVTLDLQGYRRGSLNAATLQNKLHSA
jgi:PP-loop superfamily ATP-utilizing enzyme